jgi:hypothetical protein
MVMRINYTLFFFRITILTKRLGSSLVRHSHHILIAYCKQLIIRGDQFQSKRAMVAIC